ncbi:MAG TPA: hypothetical protein PLQ35_17830, partial [bacterium]|nr:hypothetical protein [bacterium]
RGTSLRGDKTRAAQGGAHERSNVVNIFYEGAVFGFVVGIMVCNLIPTAEWVHKFFVKSPRLPGGQMTVLQEGKVKKGGVNEAPSTPKPPGAPKPQGPPVRWLGEGDTGPKRNE